MRTVDHKVVNELALQSLYISNLTNIFVDGTRAAQSKSKYANWRIPIEEFETLATTKFASEFSLMFSLEKGI